MGKFTLNKTGQQINNILDKAVLTDTEQTISGAKTFSTLISASEGVDTGYIHADDDMTIMAENGAIKLVSADSAGEAVTINDAVATINSKANDNAVVHKTGNESINGQKTFHNPATFESPVVVKNPSLATFTVQDTNGEHSVYMGTNVSNSWITVTDGISEPEHLSSTMSSSGFTVDKTSDDNITDLSTLTESKLEFQSNFDETYEPTDITHYGKKSFSIVSGSDDLFYVGLDNDNKAHLSSANDLTIAVNNGSVNIEPLGALSLNCSEGSTAISAAVNTTITAQENVVVGDYNDELPSELHSGHYYDAGVITEPLSFQLASGPDNAVYEIEFTTPESGEIPFVVFPENLKWENASTPALQNNYTYVITIRHGLASYKKFAEPR